MWPVQLVIQIIMAKTFKSKYSSLKKHLLKILSNEITRSALQYYVFKKGYFVPDNYFLL